MDLPRPQRARTYPGLAWLTLALLLPLSGLLPVTGLQPERAEADDAPAARPTGLTVAPATHDFGDVGQEEEHEAVFQLHNQGTEAITAMRATADCGCYGVTLSATHLAPGAKATLTVAFRTLRFAGRFTKRAKLHWMEAGEGHQAKLGLTLAVRKGIVLDSRAWFGEVLAGETPEPVTIYARYHRTAGRAFRITRITPPKGIQVVGEPAAWRDPGDPDVMGYAITLGFTGAPARGQVSGRIVLETDHPDHPTLTLPVQASVVGKVALQVNRLSLGIIPQGRTRTVKTRLRATRPDAFPLGSVTAKARKGILEVTVTPAANQPGAYDIVVRVPEGTPAGRLDDTIDIETGVAGEAKVALAVTGRVFKAR